MIEERVREIMREFKAYDKSFEEKPTTLTLIFGGRKYNSSEAKEIWHRGIEYGVELGLNKASIDGQKIELNNNTMNPRHREFLDKFYKLASDYGCSVQYHPRHGMVIIDRNPNDYETE